MTAGPIRRFSLAASVLVAAALAPAAAAQAPSAPRGTPIAPALAVETFDTAWSVVGRTYFDSTFGGLDWSALRDELRPRAEAAGSYEALRVVLNDLVGRLGQSHFGVTPGDVQDRLSVSDDERGEDAGSDAMPEGPQGEPGFDFRLIGDRFVVTRVDSGGAAAAAGVRPGWTVDAVEGEATASLVSLLDSVPAAAKDARTRRLMGWSALRVGLAGRAGDTVPVRFGDGEGRPREARLVLAPLRGTPVKFGNLPEMAVRVESARLPLEGGRTVGVIRFNYWMPVAARQLDAAVDALRDADGMVVDLRGNVGGVGFMSAGFAGHFIDRPDTLATMITRENRLFYVVNPRRVDTRARAVAPFAGPVAILVDEATVSTSEFFAGGMQELGRARVFGETSAGQALPAFARRLPNGDVLMHAVADFTGPLGRRFEGRGVVPDVAAPPTREALLAGRDPALEAALAWIREETSTRRE